MNEEEIYKKAIEGYVQRGEFLDGARFAKRVGLEELSSKLYRITIDNLKFQKDLRISDGDELGDIAAEAGFGDEAINYYLRGNYNTYNFKPYYRALKSLEIGLKTKNKEEFENLIDEAMKYALGLDYHHASLDGYSILKNHAEKFGIHNWRYVFECKVKYDSHEKENIEYHVMNIEKKNKDTGEWEFVCRPLIDPFMD